MKQDPTERVEIFPVFRLDFSDDGDGAEDSDGTDTSDHAVIMLRSRLLFVLSLLLVVV